MFSYLLFAFSLSFTPYTTFCINSLATKRQMCKAESFLQKNGFEFLNYVALDALIRRKHPQCDDNVGKASSSAISHSLMHLNYVRVCFHLSLLHPS